MYLLSVRCRLPFFMLALLYTEPLHALLMASTCAFIIRPSAQLRFPHISSCTPRKMTKGVTIIIGLIFLKNRSFSFIQVLWKKHKNLKNKNNTKIH
ncbi:hypothetical protein CW304_16455 [Bacillus sp. UFRGS-B20]|nr:hypothetical protein CW304_16455 [Bacillus sp. UFRGS-B20]